MKIDTNTASWFPLTVMFISMAAGNFLYQCFGDMDWRQAAARSFFQGSAFLVVGLVHKFSK